jgi:hypothetical protein
MRRVLQQQQALGNSRFPARLKIRAQRFAESRQAQQASERAEQAGIRIGHRSLLSGTPALTSARPLAILE